VVIELSNAATHPHLGLPDFLVPQGDAALETAARTVADVLRHDLDFEREYDVIPRAASAGIPPSPASALPFQPWNEMGADFVLVGAATRHGTEITIELRMIGIRGDLQGRQAFGAAYPNCRVDNPRYCAHAIADDFHKKTRGLDGVARTRLAFASDRDGARVVGRPGQTLGRAKEIYLADYDGAGVRRVTVNRNLTIHPVWSPGGDALAYVSYVSGFPDIYLANLAHPGRALERPAHGTAAIQNVLPAWSPDGTTLAMAVMRDRRAADIWTVRRDGTNLQRLTTDPGSDVSPTWSPDGAKIAFISDRAGHKQLYVMSANGTGQERLSDVDADRPTWSALNFIAFASGYPTPQIALYDFNRPGEVAILTHEGANDSPAIAPNGRHIAFVTSRWGGKQIAVIDRTGDHAEQITHEGRNEFPNWSSMPR
jgi:TolB protein